MTKKPTKKPAKWPKPPAKRTRAISIRVMANASEKRTLEKAAKKTGRPVTRMVLELALAKLEEGMAAIKAKRDAEGSATLAGENAEEMRPSADRKKQPIGRR